MKAKWADWEIGYRGRVKCPWIVRRKNLDGNSGMATAKDDRGLEICFRTWKAAAIHAKFMNAQILQNDTPTFSLHVKHDR